MPSRPSPAAYESLREGGQDEKGDPAVIDATEVGPVISQDVRTTLYRLRLATTVLAALVVFMAMSWITREISTQRVSVTTEVYVNGAGANADSLLTTTSELFSPAMAATKWKKVVFHNNFHGDRTPWQGPPTDEVDKAWENSYIDIGVIKIPKADADRLPNQTLPIPGEDDGYIVGVEVYHQLHCLDLIRRHLYPDRYGADTKMSPQGRIEYWIHLEHCIDNLRQTIMCYSDITTIPWKVNERLQAEFPDAHTTHMCRDFDALTEWMLHPDRHFPQEKYQLRVDALRAGVGQ